MIDSYDALVQAIVQVAEDDGDEFAAFIPTAIQFAEERLYKELDLPDLEETLTTTCNQGSQSVPLPNSTDLLEFIQVKDNTLGRTRILQKRSSDYLEDYWPNTATQDLPKYWAWLSKGPFFDTNGNKTPTAPLIKLTPIPDSNLTILYRGYVKPPLLAVTNQKNYFTEKCSHILYAAAMSEMAKFMKAWSQVDVWETDYNTKASAWNINMARFRGDGQQANQNPVPADNTLKSKIKTTT